MALIHLSVYVLLIGFPLANSVRVSKSSELSASTSGEGDCSVGFIVRIEDGKVKLPRGSCTIEGTSLTDRHHMTCTSKPNPLLGKTESKVYEVYCCGGELTTTACEGGVVEDAKPAAHEYSEETQQCAAGEWVKTEEGPKMMGGASAGVTVSPDFAVREKAESDEECRKKCCDSGECWGMVRKKGNPAACWLLLLPTDKVGSGTDPNYYMEAKPAALTSKIKYPHTFDFVVPLLEPDVARIVDELEKNDEGYFKESNYMRETLKRSQYSKADRSASVSYLGRFEGQKVELRFYSGGTAEEYAKDDCDRLNSITGKYVAKCLGTGSAGSALEYERVEYAGMDELSFAVLPLSAPDVLIRVLLKQVVLAHLEFIASGHVLRDGKTSVFTVQANNKKGCSTYEMSSDEFVVKATTISGADPIKGTKEGTKEAPKAVVDTIFAMLAPVDNPMPACARKAMVDWKHKKTVQWFTNTLEQCASKESGPAVDAFLGDGGAELLVLLLGDGDGKTTLEAALKTKYFDVAVPDPDALNFRVARAFETCETVGKLELKCKSGRPEEVDVMIGKPERSARQLCEILGSTELSGFKFNEWRCQLTGKAKDLNGADKEEPMCHFEGLDEVKDENLKWGVSWMGSVAKVNGEPTTMKGICCGDKKSHFAAEHSGYFAETPVMEEVKEKLASHENVTFSCSSCGTPLFTLSNVSGRTFTEFYEESEAHGWPSFRTAEAEWENIASYDFPRADLTDMTDPAKPLYERLKKNSFETHCSTCGAHLGHNIPDENGIRLCIDLGCISGKSKSPLVPEAKEKKAATNAKKRRRRPTLADAKKLRRRRQHKKNGAPSSRSRPAPRPAGRGSSARASKRHRKKQT